MSGSTFNVDIDNTPSQVYILLYSAHSDGGVISVRSTREKALEDHKMYREKPMLINEFLNDIYNVYWVEEDPNDAIEVWSVK